MNKIIYLIVSLILLSSIVTAASGPSLPMPIAIKVITPNAPFDLKGIDVTVRDLTHPYTMVVKTNDFGEVSIDWNNALVKGAIGDSFEIIVGTTKVNSILGDIGLNNGLLYVDITKSCPAITVCPQIECPIDTTPYSYNTCPIKEVIKEVPVEVIKEIQVEKIVYKEPEPKDWTNETIIVVLSGLALVFGAYKGYWRFQTRKKVYRQDGSYYYTWETKATKTSTGTKVVR